MEAFKEEIVMILRELLAKDGITIRGVYERSDANERTKEGLPKVKGFIGEEFDTTIEIVENGVHYLVDVANGQKTGFFLDQKYNRLAMQRVCKGKKVLDCFTHMGTFALNAGIAGASDVTGLDISEYAVSQAEANARLNGLQSTPSTSAVPMCWMNYRSLLLPAKSTMWLSLIRLLLQNPEKLPKMPSRAIVKST